MIRNIVFDMGKVLIDFNPDSFMDHAGITDPADRKIVRQELFSSIEWAQMDMGIATEDSIESAVLSRVPEHLREGTRHLLHNWYIPRRMIPGMEEMVRRLKEAGYGIYLLSNASVNQPVYWNQLPVSRYFDGVMISAFVKTVKPCPEIYRLFTGKFGLKEEECLFVDDAPINVAGAVACGWQGIVFYGDADQLETRMKDMGIRF
ncbi:MAG: HAD family phosphatase [Clostridiales bacterium]|nr:HAD family phosphatase [Clostridiales bacterium]